MPSPIAHASIALLAGAAAKRHERLWRVIRGRTAFIYVAAVAALWAPDVDFIIRIFVDDPAFRHGGATHSLLAGVLIGLAFAVACLLWYGASLPLGPAASIGIACGCAHGLMDMATYGSGVMLLWPFSLERFRTPVPLFFGARHSRPYAWDLHLVTLVTELLFVGLVWWIARILGRRRVGLPVAPTGSHAEVR